MKISRREKHLIWIAGAVVVSLGYYNFIYANQAAALAEKKEELTTLKNQYDINVSLIEGLATKSARMEETYNALITRRNGYYSDIVGEKIIVKLEDLLKASGLKADFEFSDLTVDNIEVLSVGSEEILKDTLEEYSDRYNGNTTTSSQESTSESNNNDASNNNNSSTGLTKEVVKQQKVILKFNGTYESLKLFMNLAEANSRKIVISNLNIRTESNVTNEISGEMQLEFYSISSLNKEETADSTWTIDNIYGKDNFISGGAATGAYNTSDKSDFSLILRAAGSELPTVSLGQTSDTEQISTVKSTRTNIVDVTIEFNEEDGKLYYKYTVGNETFPKDNSQLGMNFTSKSDDIILDVLSTERIGTSDNSGVNLKIINNTVKNVNIIVTADDATKPRVNATSEGKVTVTKK